MDLSWWCASAFKPMRVPALVPFCYGFFWGLDSTAASKFCIQEKAVCEFKMLGPSFSELKLSLAF